MKLFLLKSLLVLLLTFVALMCLLISYTSYKNVSEIGTWKQITTTVASATTEQQQRKKGITYCPKIMVSFELGGQQYMSKLQVTDAPCSPLRETVERTVQSYAVGNAYNVYVNPSKPIEVRALTYSLGWSFYVVSIVGVLALIGVGATFFIPANKTLNRTRAADAPRAG